MRPGRARLALSGMAAVCVGLAGCAPPPPLPPADQVLAALSYAVLQPEMTCAELREDYGLDDLPLADTPGDVGISYGESWLPAPSGALLRVWHMPAENERGTVLVSSGNTGPMACYLYTARLLIDGGWSVVMYDYEGFGQSTGRPSLETLRDDLASVLSWTLDATGSGSVTLFGMSLGSIPSVAVAIDRPAAVNGVVLDSPVAMGVEIERFRVLIRGRSAEVIAIVADALPWLLTENLIGQMRQPLLVFMHEEDIVTPAFAVELLYERAGGPKEMITFAGLNHAEGQFARTEEYSSHLHAFLEAAWSD